MTDRFARVPIGAASDSRLSRSALRVLIALCGYVDRDGRAFPSQKELADAAGIRRQGVNAAMTELRNAGWVQVEHVQRDQHGRFGKQRLRVLYGADTANGATVSGEGGHGPCPHREDMDRVPPVPDSTVSPLGGHHRVPPGEDSKKQPNRTAQEEQPNVGSARKKRRSQIPDDWQPTETDIAYAVEKGFSVEEVGSMADEFADYWTREGKPMADWSATWRRNVDKRASWRRDRPAGKASSGFSGLAAVGDVFDRFEEGQR